MTRRDEWDEPTSPNPRTAYDDADERRTARADGEHLWHDSAPTEREIRAGEA